MEVIIEAYSKKGHGISHQKKNGSILLALKGERVRITPLRKKKKEELYVIQEILEGSKDRIQPRCCHFSSCGGCSFQHLDYPEQLKEKENFLKTLFPHANIDPAVGLEEPWHFRSKMEFTFSESLKGERFLGLMERASFRHVVNIEDCLIFHPWGNEVLERVRTWWYSSTVMAYYPPKDKGALKTLTLRTNRDGTSKMVILTVSGNAEYALSRKEIESFGNAAAFDDQTSVFLLIHMATPGERTQMYEMHLRGPSFLSIPFLDKEIRIGPQSFFQPNIFIAEKMFKRGIELLELSKKEVVLDLYSGVGTIGIALSPYVKQVISVEEVMTSVIDARENIERLQLENIQIYQEDVGQFLKRVSSLLMPDIIVIDPPRGGLLPQAIKEILTLDVKRILYISCNAESQKRDIDLMRGYKIERVCPFDQFPHTPHMESIILLTKESFVV